MARAKPDAPELEAPSLEPATLEPAGAPRRRSRRAEPAAAAADDGSPAPAGTRIAPALAPLRVPIDRYRRHPDNPRRHPHLAELRESYRRWGQLKPVVVQASTGYIVAGNGLHEAMTAEGAEEIAANPVDLDETEADAYLLADNKLGEMGGYDYAALTALLDRQDQTGTLAGTGYSVGDLDRMMRGLDNGRTDADDAPALTRDEPWVRPGELYALGDHRLLVGDATDPAAWDRLLGGRTADAIWTDPPYGVGYYGKTDEHLRIAGDSRDHGHGRQQARIAELEEGDMSLEEMLETAFRLALERTKPGGAVFCASPAGPNAGIFTGVLGRLGVHRQTLIWVKDVFVMGRSDYHYRHEPILYGEQPGDQDASRAAGDDASHGSGGDASPRARSDGSTRGRRAKYREAEPVHYGWRKGAAHYFTDDRTLDTVWEIDRPKASREHPTMKPVELVERALLTATRRRDVVLDPFVGSGTTIIAAENTRRTAYAMDIDPRYAQVALERWQAYTGKRATRLE
jgi:DNA modification methylase